MSTILTFQNTSFDVIDQNGQPWLQARQLASALGYKDENSVRKIYERNKDEFSVGMTTTVNLTVGLTPVEIRIFSLRGCHLLAMFARTAIAKDFRVWVLDVLERETQRKLTQAQPALPPPLASIAYCTLPATLNGVIPKTLPDIPTDKGASLPREKHQYLDEPITRWCINLTNGFQEHDLAFLRAAVARVAGVSSYNKIPYKALPKLREWVLEQCENSKNVHVARAWAYDPAYEEEIRGSLRYHLNKFLEETGAIFTGELPAREEAPKALPSENADKLFMPQVMPPTCLSCQDF